MLGVNEHMGLKLFGREIIFEEFQIQPILIYQCAIDNWRGEFIKGLIAPSKL